MAFLTVGQEGINKTDAENDTFQKIFLTALLLTGSAAKAECAIEEGINTLGAWEVSCTDLLNATLRAAVAPRRKIRRETSEISDLYTACLPVELRRVILLPEGPRQCFVLHLLVGMAVHQCSRLLSLNDSQVEQNIVSAPLALIAAEAGQSATHGNVEFPSGVQV